MKKTTDVKIKWSIHLCRKVEIKGKIGTCIEGYMTVQKIGRKTERLMHDTLGAALKHVGI